jgi:hypothetical protein
MMGALRCKLLSKGGGTVTGLPALLVFIVTFYFMILVFRQYRRNHRLSHVLWTISLLLSAVGSLAYALAVWTQAASGIWFILYYICGALWMAAMMGLGSLALVVSKRTVYVITVIVAVLGVVGTVGLMVAPLSLAALSHLDGGAGTGVVGVSALWLVPLIVLNTFGAVAVPVVALVSAWRLFRRSAPKRFFLGNLWLAIGVLIIAGAGSAARLGWPGFFWIAMLVGWVVAFGGFRLLSVAPEQRTVASHATPTLQNH